MNLTTVPEIISKKDAIEKGLILYYTGIPCKYNHLDYRRITTGDCLECAREAARKHKKTQKWRDTFAIRKEQLIESGEYKRRNQNNRLRSQFGISLKDYDMMVHNQNNRCLICDITFDHSNKTTKPHVDHCHNTNKIRGLLCMNCNIGIGFLNDNISVLNNAINYLSREK